MTEQDKLQKIEKSDEYPERLKEMAKKTVRRSILYTIIWK